MEDKNFDCLKLSNQLCFPLYACARETIKLYTPHLDQIGLTYTQYITMMVLWERQTAVSGFRNADTAAEKTGSQKPADPETLRSR